jgi:hypothetical protein
MKELVDYISRWVAETARREGWSNRRAKIILKYYLKKNGIKEKNNEKI